MKKGHKRQSGFSWDMQWGGKFVRYKHIGKVFKVAGAADKAGLSKAIAGLCKEPQKAKF